MSLQNYKPASGRIAKPDFNTAAGRVLFAEYLGSKFKHLIEYDRRSSFHLFKSIKPDFTKRFLKRLIENPERRVLIGIFGESASGKTTICNTIEKSIKKFNMPVEILSCDNYFRDISELIKKHGSFDNLLASGYDVDSPDNFNLEQLYNDLLKLVSGEDVKIPQYLVNGEGISVPEAIPKKAAKIIAAEGMASLHGKSAELFDIKIYIDINPDIQREWFIKRAVTSRNQNEENALKQLAYVREASKKYILPKKDSTDIVINGACPLEYFEQIIEYFYNALNNFI